MSEVRTWQTILKPQLESLVHAEGTHADNTAISNFTSQLDEESDREQTANQLTNLGLGYFANNLRAGIYDDMARLKPEVDSDDEEV